MGTWDSKYLICNHVMNTFNEMRFMPFIFVITGMSNLLSICHYKAHMLIYLEFVCTPYLTLSVPSFRLRQQLSSACFWRADESCWPGQFFYNKYWLQTRHVRTWMKGLLTRNTNLLSLWLGTLRQKSHLALKELIQSIFSVYISTFTVYILQ